MVSNKVRRAIYCAASTAALAASMAAEGSTFTWIKTGGGTWSIPSNWSPSGPPTSSDQALFNLNATYTVILPASESVATLSVGTTSSGAVTINAAGHTLTFGAARFLTGATAGTVNFNGGTLNQTGIVNSIDVEDWLNVGTGAFLGNINSLSIGTLNNGSLNLSAATLLINSLGFGEPDNVLGASGHNGIVQLDFGSVGTINNATEVGQTNGTGAGFLGVFNGSKLTLQNLSIGVQTNPGNFSVMEEFGASLCTITQTGASNLTIGSTAFDANVGYQGTLQVANGTFITGSGSITVNAGGQVEVGNAGVLQINGNMAATGYILSGGSISAAASTIQVNGTTSGFDPDMDPIAIPTLDNLGNISGGTLIVGGTAASYGWARTSGGVDSASFSTAIVGGLGSGTLDIGDDGSLDEKPISAGNFHAGSLLVAQTATSVGNINLIGSLTAGSATIGGLGSGFLSMNGHGSMTLTGPVVIADGSTSFGSVYMYGSGIGGFATFSAAGQSMTVGNAGVGTFAIQDFSVVNLGTLQIGSLAGGRGNVVQFGTSNTLLLSVTASTIHIGSSSGGMGTYTLGNGTLNVGSIDITANGTFIENAGTINGNVNVNGGGFIYKGGAINGPLSLNTGTLAVITPFPSLPFTLNVGPGGTILFNGSSAGPFSGSGFGIFTGAATLNNSSTLSGNGTLQANQTLNNNGTFSSANGDFTIVAGATLSNSSTGLLANSPASNLRVLTTNFTNLGSLRVNADGGVQLATSLTIPSGKSLSMLGGLFTNGASLTIAAGGSLSGFGQIDANLTNHGSSTFAGSMSVLGNLTNDGVITARDSTSIVYGSVSNTGSILVQNGTIIFDSSLSSSPAASGGVDGAGIVNVSADGRFLASYVRQNAMTMSGASLDPAIAAIRTRDAGGDFSRLNALSIASGKLDLADTSLIADATSLSAIRGFLVTGFNGGNWQGLGLTSSSAAAVAADPSNTHKTALGFATASALGISSFLGQSVAPTSVLVRYTLAGDENLDGTVSTADFTALAAHFGSGVQWTDGDFNFDGIVNALDFNAIATNFGQVISAPPLGSLVPEPAALAATLLASPWLRRRRRSG